MWEGYYGKTYPFSRLTDFFEEATRNVEIVKKGKIEYFNVPCSFDIETTSWVDGQDKNGNPIKMSTMYIWQFGLNGSVIYGRTWDEFGEFLERVDEELELSESRRLIIYVHNLGYEFQFMRKYFEWDKVFAIKQRRPVYAISGGFEFRCSLFLSNYALAYIGDNLLHKYPVKKLVGNLDYSKPRHSSTPLTPDELDYCINDVRVVMSYIQEKIENEGDITKIPLTNTGYVRNYCREECFYEGTSPVSPERNKVRKNYAAIMKSLQVTSADEYKQMKRGFMGGFTHASALYSGQILYNVGSADLTSSYPYAMVSDYFPCTKGEFIGSVSDMTLFQHYLTKYCCLFDIQFINLLPRVEFENPLSDSRCYCSKDKRVNNGRIISASSCVTTLTELDFETVTKFYSWDAIKVSNLRVFRRGYLPKALILAVLKLYEDKTTLKGIAGKEVEYLVSKNMINASFGMMVTNIIRDEFIYDDVHGWSKASADVVSQLTAYNTNFNRFLYYGWGVWVTAHARHNLFSAIYEFGADYVYSDTDSIKGINFADHEQYFKQYNDQVFDKLLKMCNHYNIPFSKCRPKNKKGEAKLIGVWEMEEGYKIFKTVGAKRYMYVNQDGSLGMTVAGINKKHALPYLISRYVENIPEGLDILKLAQDAYLKEDSEAMQKLISLDLDYIPIFGHFGDGLFVPAGHTGKMTLTYIDHPIKAILTDYLGLPKIVEEESGIYMEPQSYLMSQLSDYLKFLDGIQEVQY